MRSSAPVHALASAFLLLALSGCAHQAGSAGSATSGGARSRAAAKGGKSAGPVATGTWDWVFRSTDEDGNLRVEQEEWHLTQDGAAVEGYYDRAVTLLSQDERLFKCNQQLGYTRFTRVRITGEIANGPGNAHSLRLRELDYHTRPGPCDDGARILVSYEGELGASTLRLWFAERTGQQTLTRREGGGPALAKLVGYEEAAPPAPDGSRSTLPVTGVWEWGLKSVDADGDERIEHEEWHLDEAEGEVTGWYQRQVSRQRGDGNYSCNGEAQFDTRTRYDIRGHRVGDTVTLTETSYKAEPGPCDNGQRRLDVYQGSVSKSGGELMLTWGGGNQVLRRRAAVAPQATK